MRPALVLAALLALPAAAAAAGPSNGVTLLQGHCRRLVVGGHDFTGGCAGKLADTSSSDDRKRFSFITDDGMVVAFSGLGSRQTKLEGGTVVMPVDAVVVGAKGRTDRWSAVGTCRFDDPAGGPAPITCEAEGRRGRYAGFFMTDGGPPDRTAF